MPSTKDINLSGRNQFLFVGTNGSGKTVAAASFYKLLPAGAKVFFIDFDGRMNPVKFMYPDADIEYETYGPNNFAAFKAKLDELTRMPKYPCLVLDSCTSLSISCVNYQLKVKGVGAGDERKGKVLGGGLIQVTTWDEINGETILFSQILDFLKTYPGTVIVTAHPVEKTEISDKDKGKRFKSLVAYGPKVASIIPNYFNEIYTFTTEVNVDPSKPSERYCITSDDGVNIGKTALPLPLKFSWTNRDFFPMLREFLKEKGITLGTP
jgi:hypothetical protein